MRKMIIALLIVLMLIPSLTFGVSANAADDSADTMSDNFVIGNVNGDEFITVKDATAIQKHVAGIFVLDAANLKLADTDGNKKVDVRDATTLQKFLADLTVDSLIGQVPIEPKPPVETGVNIGGNTYSVYKGEYFNYNVYLQADELFENIQAVVNYDSEKLDLVRIYSDDPDVSDWEVEGPVRCPNLDMVIFNADLDNEVRFNASNIHGYDFTEEKELITLEFFVKNPEYSEISLDIEYMTVKGDGSEKYFYKGEPVITDGIRIYETLFIYHLHENCPNEYLQ